MQLSEHAIRYTLSHLLKVAFPHIMPAISIENQSISAKIDDICIHFSIMDEKSRDTLVAGNLACKKWEVTPILTVPLHLPNTEEKFYQTENQSITILCDLITLPFIFLSRWEEAQPNANRDTHGRFRFEGSLTQKYDVADIPLADAYAMLLRQWVCQLFPRLQIPPRQSQIISTHDVDILTRFGNLKKSVRTLAADLLKYRSPQLCKQSVQQFFAFHNNFRLDPYLQACDMLFKQDEAAARESIFFIKAQKAGEHDCTFDIAGKEAAYLVKYLHENNVRVGLHGSYKAASDSKLFSLEKRRLESLYGDKIELHRQHYLRFLPTQTQSCWESAGIREDYTLGFAEREGFRCGTCHPYPLYDLANDRPTAIIEHPLIAMDMTFIQYRKMKVEKTLLKIKELQNICQQMEGDFVLLWHNTTVWREYTTWYESVFCKL